ncbi:hypothetical protein PENSPDRAFT_546085, partial [Peniophora sp. CONT]
SAVNAATGYAPFELTYGYMPHIITSIHPTTQESPGVVSFVQQALDTLAMAHDAIIAARTRATYESNKHRQGDTKEKFSVGQKVYVSTEN